MLRDRGYSVPASEIDLSLQDFRFLHGPTPYIGRLRFSTTHCTDPSDRMLVIYCGPGIVKVNVIRGLHSQIKDTLAGLILITQNQVTNQALKTLELYLFKTEIFRVCFRGGRVHVRYVVVEFVYLYEFFSSKFEFLCLWVLAARIREILGSVGLAQ
nr:DNA-directed RNA polymerase V subunit 5A-like isoform X2 [Malus domestica]